MGIYKGITGLINKEHKKIPLPAGFFCGERGIRTPGGVTLNGFQDRRIRPLCHFSAAKIDEIFGLRKYFFEKLDSLQKTKRCFMN